MADFKWEYLVEDMGGTNSLATTSELNNRGEEGWELVSIKEFSKPNPKWNDPRDVRAYFKRKVLMLG